MWVFIIKGNGLAMELIQMLTEATTIVEHKDVLLGLVFINK